MARLDGIAALPTVGCRMNIGHDKTASGMRAGTILAKITRVHIADARKAI
jgi:hypothetical protein